MGKMGAGRYGEGNSIQNEVDPSLELEDPKRPHRPTLTSNAGDNTDQCGGCQENLGGIVELSENCARDAGRGAGWEEGSACERRRYHLNLNIIV